MCLGVCFQFAIVSLNFFPPYVVLQLFLSILALLVLFLLLVPIVPEVALPHLITVWKAGLVDGVQRVQLANDYTEVCQGRGVSCEFFLCC